MSVLPKEGRGSLFYWYPKVKALDTIPMPETYWVEIPYEDLFEICECDEPTLQQFWTKYSAPILEAVNKIGFPLFMRTDYFSGKHNYDKTCYVPSQEVLLDHIYDLVIDSVCADICGIPMHGLAFRKFLDLDTKFTYFTGNLPIGKERRYFIRKGKVQCHHHYWVQEAFDQRYMIAQDYTSTQYNKLMRILAKLNKEDPEEITLLTKYAQQIADIMPEYYSVDFAMDKTGKWWMIDMAKGSLSWHPKCIYADPNE